MPVPLICLQPGRGESVGNIYELAISVTGPGEVEGAGVYRKMPA